MLNNNNNNSTTTAPHNHNNNNNMKFILYNHLSLYLEAVGRRIGGGEGTEFHLLHFSSL